MLKNEFIVENIVGIQKELQIKNILFSIPKWNNLEEIIDKRIKLIKDQVNRFCDQAKLINYNRNG